MKQFTMFGKEEDKEEKKYTPKIETPIYEPKNAKPHLLELVDNIVISFGSNFKRYLP